MKTPFSILAILITVLSGCKEPAETKPGNLLDEEKMIAVMVDMHLVETANNLKLLASDTAEQQYNEIVEKIYATHEVSKGSFDSSLFYYSTQTEQMNVIYDKILEHLYELESEVNAAHSDH
jgi:hypothetical protein